MLDVKEIQASSEKFFPDKIRKIEKKNKKGLSFSVCDSMLFYAASMYLKSLKSSWCALGDTN